MSRLRLLPFIFAALALIATSCGASSGGGTGAEEPTDPEEELTAQTGDDEAEDGEAESTTDAPDETFGITPTVLHEFQLEQQIPELAGLDYRGRIITFEPGGATNEHEHTDRPGMVYVLEGAVTEHRDTESTVYAAGESWVEGIDATHWVENHTDQEAVVLTVDIVETPDEPVEQLEKTGTKVTFEGEAPA